MSDNVSSAEVDRLQAVLAGVREAATKYAVLSVARDATLDQIKVAYRRLAMLYHPDRYQNGAAAVAEEIFKEVAAAHRILSNETERARYDRALASGRTFQERADAEQGAALVEILDDLQRYEHVFSEEALDGFSDTLKKIVRESLLGNLREQIVAVYKMPKAPSGAPVRGTYQPGAIVVTTLRVLFPYSFQWQEQSGNTTTTYTQWAMPGVPLPSVDSLTFIRKGRLFPDDSVRLETGEATIEFVPGQFNTSKLLLVASLWGIPVKAVSEPAPSAELRRGLAQGFLRGAGIAAAALVIAACIGIFAGGVIDNPIWVATWANDYGGWQVLFVVSAAMSAANVARWVVAYRTEPLSADAAESTAVAR